MKIREVLAQPRVCFEDERLLTGAAAPTHPQRALCVEHQRVRKLVLPVDPIGYLGGVVLDGSRNLDALGRHAKTSKPRGL